MALINCPECQREISDTIKACPHCGFSLVEEVEHKQPQKVEVTAVNLKSKNPAKTKRILISVISVVLVCAIGIVGFSIYNGEKAKQARNEYIDNLNLLTVTMLIGASDSESICNLTAQVWRDTIYKEYNKDTAKYTIVKSSYSASKTIYNKYEYEDDFNTALAKLFIDSGTVSKTDSIKKNKELVNDIMKKLKNPTAEFEKCYATVEELFSAYQGLTDLAVNPSGSFQTFSQSKNDKVDKFMEYYKRLNNQIPEKDE